MTTRRQEEIVARLRAVRADGQDVFGFREEVILDALDFDHAREFLVADATPQQWDQQTDHEAHARRYLTFAIEEIIDHRSNSASRSVEKLGEFAWLLGRDDVVTAMDSARYPMYGAPKVKAFADGFGWPFHEAGNDPDDLRALTRMAQGEQCDPHGCARGCAQ
jgi:hypothetical protein